MIVPMKKVAILVQSKDSAESIQMLRSLAVVHVEHQRLPRGKDIHLLEEDIALIKQALGILSQEEFTRPNQSGVDRSPEDWRFTARHIVDLRNRLNQLQDYELTLRERISRWQAWGEFDPAAIQALRNQGLQIKLYQIPAKQVKNIATEAVLKKISVFRGMANCLVISQKEINLTFKEVTLPKMGLAAMKARLLQDSRTIKQIKDQIRSAASYREALLRIQYSLQEELEFHQALSGMGEEQGLNYLRGYIPYDEVAHLEQAARKQKWAVVINEPSPEDKVPTLIRNPRWIYAIKPVFKLIEVIPGYKELDISLWFLLFLSLFVGMLIGDAGIGLVFFGLTLFFQKKLGKKLRDKSIFGFLYICSAAAVIWGALSGTFFGQEWLPEAVHPLIPALRSERNIQNICFLLGATHLSIAHLWRAIIKLPSLKALAEAGWISILWGAFFLAKMLILGDLFPVYGKWFFISGAILILLFTSSNRNFFKSLGAGLGSLLLNLVNSFTDVVSYVRLFAVGLATVAVADAFNRMATDIGFSSILAGITAAAVLLLGHTLNILLAPMSILVHGVRLNVLEFCNHADVKWSGLAYKPLVKKRQ